MLMIIGILKEPAFETRVSLLPEHVTALKKNNIEVVVEQHAGATAFATDGYPKKITTVPGSPDCWPLLLKVISKVPSLLKRLIKVPSEYTKIEGYDWFTGRL